MNNELEELEEKTCTQSGEYRVDLNKMTGYAQNPYQKLLNAFLKSVNRTKATEKFCLEKQNKTKTNQPKKQRV